MAWLSVRDTIETWLTAAPTVFHPTINEEQEPSEDLWMTVMFGFSQSDIINFCRDHIDYGTFTVVHYGNPGLGWRPVIQAAEDVKDYLMGVIDPTNKIEIRNHGFPIEFTGGDAQPWYGVEIIYDFVVFN